MNKLGKVGWEVACNFDKCSQKFWAVERKDASKAWRDHDRSHASARRAEAQKLKDAKRDARQAKKDAAAQKKQAKQEKKAHKQRKDDAKKEAFQKRRAAADKKNEESTPVKKFSGLHTKGIPNVKDGQNINGIVYDRDGHRVPPETIRKYSKGW
jgi:hypothetical protein